MFAAKIADVLDTRVHVIFPVLSYAKERGPLFLLIVDGGCFLRSRFRFFQGDLLGFTTNFRNKRSESTS